MVLTKTKAETYARLDTGERRCVGFYGRGYEAQVLPTGKLGLFIEARGAQGLNSWELLGGS